jgi:hypothetical protein
LKRKKNKGGQMGHTKNILQKNRQEHVVNFTNILQVAFSCMSSEICFHVGKDSFCEHFMRVFFKFLKELKSFKYIFGTSELYQSQNIFHQILVNDEIRSLATGVLVRGFSNVDHS